MSSRWCKRLFLIVLILFLSPVLVLAEPQLYGVNALDDGLSLIDPKSGDVEFIGPLSSDPDRFITPIALASNPTDKTLYVWNNSDTDQKTGVLLTVDPESGRATVVNPELGPQGQLSALAMTPDAQLYGLDSQLFSIDLKSGEKVFIGSLGDGLRIAGADFNSQGILYGLTFNRELVKVNLRTGEAYDIIPLRSNIGVPGSITFNPETGVLVGSGMGGDLGNIIFDIVPDDLPYAIISNVRQLTETAPQGMDFIDPALAEVPFSLSLHIEDALEGVVVSKVVGDIGEGPTNFARLEITAKLLSRSSLAINDIPVTLTVPGNVLDSPSNVWTRKSDGGALTATPYTTLAPGVFRVTTDLEPTLFRPLFGKGFYYYKQIVWRFIIPAATLPQIVNVSATADVPGASDPYGSGLIKIVEPGTVRTLMVANRKLLYDHYSDYQVSSLLQRLFTEAQGFPASHTPNGVIYYLERYDSRAYNWDNTNIDYSNDTTANITADAIDDLIEDWWDDATSYIPVVFPFGIGTIQFPIASPSFLLLVGNDDTLPFYRYNDPSDDEGVNIRTSCPAADGWCVDSATNPEINATDHDYILTDNPYADLYGGSDWQTGSLELWTGRLLGDSAADMLSLLAEGVDWNNGQQGGVVMASVDGWELGLVEDDGRAGEIADLCDVSALLRGKGFAVRNDDNPVAEVQTIDVMSPFEGGSISWNSNFQDAANNAGGMDLFFIGGHDSYDHAVIPGDDFSPDDTPGDYTRFDDDHPLVMIVGCHGGLPVPDIDVPGGVDDCLVYDTIHEGARAYIGATGFSYGSPGNLHKNTWGERLIQGFFINLLKPSGSNSMALGAALGKAKREYVFGFGSKDDLDRKTLTEFNLYGVPWSFLYYPNAMAAKDLSAETVVKTLAPVANGALTEIATGDENLYTQTVWLDIDGYEVQEEKFEDIVYELFSVPGGDTAISSGLPILPFVKGYHLPLPYAAEVVKLELLETKSEGIGRFNIPIALVEPWSEEGLAYTTKSEINYPYPAADDLVQYQETAAGVDLSFFPIQHNPASKETRFYSAFQVRITYAAPLVVAVDDFNVDKALYRPEEIVRTSAEIANVGVENLALYARLAIVDGLGETVGSSASSLFEIPAGGTVNLSMPWSGVLPSGPYTAELKVFQGKAEMVSGASAGFAVLAGAISELEVPDPLYLGENGRFALSFCNYLAAAVKGEVQLTILSSIGGYRFDCLPQPLSLPGAATATAFFDWLAEAVVPGEYRAVATVTIDGQTYGPMAESFIVSAPPCLADYDADGDVDGFDLARFSLYFKSSDLLADLNSDQKLDTADIELFAENFTRLDCPLME